MNMIDGIIFDQFSRYKISSDIIKKISLDGDSILDVGSGESCILEQFLPDHKIKE